MPYKTKSILELSPEILTEIFQYLELDDRKNVRLSCRSFYDCCNRISIIKKEKFVLRNGYCIQEITKTLLSCQYIRMNLEFQGLPVDTFPVKIWKQCGDRIHSLILHQSTLNDKVIKNIILNCHNLTHWNVWVPTCFHLPGLNRSGFNSLKPFEELVRNNIVRKSLESFEVHISDESIWASIIKKIFIIFPNIKTFSVLCWCSDGTLSHIESEISLFAFTRIDKCIKSSNIERLLFDIPSNGHWLKNSVITNLRLKEIKTSIISNEQILDTLFDFFVHQKELEVVCLTVNNLPERLIKRLLFHIIKVCPNLRKLCLNYPIFLAIDLNDYEFSLILQKRLECLKFRFNVNNSYPDLIMPSVKLPLNKDLHTLIIDHHEYARNDYSVMMKYFTNLKHLYLSFITDSTLQAIFQYQTKLEVLKLHNLDDCTDFGFTGSSPENFEEKAYSIRRLQNLQCFDIDSWNSEGFTEASIDEFVFPNLKHFRFAIGVDNPLEVAKNFHKIAENSPLLEIAVIDIFSMNLSQLLEFCSKLKKLYYLDCTEANIINKDCKTLLYKIESLRYVAYDEEVFCFNPFNKKVLLKPLNYFNIHSKCCLEFPSVM